MKKETNKQDNFIILPPRSTTAYFIYTVIN